MLKHSTKTKTNMYTVAKKSSSLGKLANKASQLLRPF
jgi:hypothetical protein